VARRGVETIAVTDFNDLAEIHHGDAVAQVMNHRKIMRDEEVGQLELVLQVFQQR